MQLMPEKHSNLFSALTVAWLDTLLLSCSYQHSQCKQSNLGRCLLSKRSVGRRGKMGKGKHEGAGQVRMGDLGRGEKRQ